MRDHAGRPFPWLVLAAVVLGGCGRPETSPDPVPDRRADERVEPDLGRPPQAARDPVPIVDLESRFSIDPFAGTVAYEVLDLASPGLLSGNAHPLSVRRAYRAPEKDLDSSLGPGWRSSIETYLAIDPEGRALILVEGTAEPRAFVLDEAARVLRAVSAGADTIEGGPGGGWVLVRTAGGKSVFDARGRLVTAMGATGEALFHEYDGPRPVRIVGEQGWGLELEWEGDRLRSIADGRGTRVEYAYDGSGRLVRVRSSGGLEETYAYAGNRLAEVRLGGEARARLEYDASGRVVRLGGPAVEERRWTWRQEGTRRIGVETRGEIETTSTADETTGRRTVERQGRTLLDARVDPATRRLEIGGAGRPISVGFDALGRIERVETGGEVEVRRYDGQGRLAGIDSAGGRRSYGYDDHGRLARIEEDSGPDQAFGYGEDGRLRSIDVGGGARAIEHRDTPAGRVIEVSLPGGGRVHSTHDGSGRVVEQGLSTGYSARFRYDRDGLLEGFEDSLGRRADVRRAPGGLPIEIAEGEDRATRYEYDERGRFVRAERPEGDATSVRYDPGGRRVTVVDPLGAETEVEFDDAERPIGFRHPDGGRETREYAPGGLVRRVDPDGTEIRVGRDAAGERASLATREVDVEFVRDPRGRLLEERSPEGRLEFELDAAGWRTRLVDHAARQEVRWRRDETGRVLAIETAAGTIEYEYGPTGELARLRCGEAWIAWERGPFGEPAAVRFSNGVVERRTYEPRLLTASLDVAAGDRSLFRAGYEWTPEGRRAAERDDRRGSVRYAYDRNGRLVEARPGSGDATRYEYDAAGNRTAEVRGPARTKYAYDRASRLLSRGETRYEHDDCGRIVARVRPEGTDHYVWDGLGRLVEVRTGEGRVVRYGYDSSFRRLWREVDGVRTRYLWDRDELLAEIGPDGSVEALYLNGTGVDDSLGVLGKDGVRFFHKDPIGSVRLVTDGAGAVAATADYDPFGALVASTGPRGPPLFASRDLDPVTGLYWFRLRWYDPETGRFLTRDPEGLDGEANPYLYAGADPLSRIDPYGTGLLDIVKKLAFLTGPVGSTIIGAVLDAFFAWKSDASFAEIAIEAAGGAVEGFLRGGVPAFAHPGASAALAFFVKLFKELLKEYLIRGHNLAEITFERYVEILIASGLEGFSAGLLSKFGPLLIQGFEKLGFTGFAEVLKYVFEAAEAKAAGAAQTAGQVTFDKLLRDIGESAAGKTIQEVVRGHNGKVLQNEFAGIFVESSENIAKATVALDEHPFPTEKRTGFYRILGVIDRVIVQRPGGAAFYIAREIQKYQAEFASLSRAEFEALVDAIAKVYEDSVQGLKDELERARKRLAQIDSMQRLSRFSDLDEERSRLAQRIQELESSIPILEVRVAGLPALASAGFALSRGELLSPAIRAKLEGALRPFEDLHRDLLARSDAAFREIEERRNDPNLTDAQREDLKSEARRLFEERTRLFSAMREVRKAIEDELAAADAARANAPPEAPALPQGLSLGGDGKGPTLFVFLDGNRVGQLPGFCLDRGLEYPKPSGPGGGATDWRFFQSPRPAQGASDLRFLGEELSRRGAFTEGILPPDAWADGVIQWAIWIDEAERGGRTIGLADVIEALRGTTRGLTPPPTEEQLRQVAEAILADVRKLLAAARHEGPYVKGLLPEPPPLPPGANAVIVQEGGRMIVRFPPGALFQAGEGGGGPGATQRILTPGGDVVVPSGGSR